jgi:uncharacterized protein YwqG
MADQDPGPGTQEIEASARANLTAVDADAFLSLLRPAIRLDHGEDGEARSRLGGSPVLDPDTAWPEWNSRPLSFLMMIDLSELQGFENDLELPRSGLLNFFYEADAQRTWGFDPDDAGSWRVILADAASDIAAAPDEALTFAEVPLRPRQVVTAPTWAEPVLEDIWQRDRDGLLAVDHALTTGGWPGAPRHQIGGWPLLVQNPIWLEAQLVSHGLYLGRADDYNDPRATDLRAGAEDWQLLAQIETDDAAGWMWGDVGTLYYAIRRQDLAQLRFDNVWMLLQCS